MTFKTAFGHCCDDWIGSALPFFFSESEGELTLAGGDYLLVWGCGESQGGYLDAELLDGRRGLVPASFVQRLIGNGLFLVMIFGIVAHALISLLEVQLS